MQPKDFVVVYGGSFDPVHKGHENIVKSLLEKRLAKEVWIVPCAKRADKNFVLTDDERFSLLEQVFHELPQVKPQRTEIQRGAMIPTYELLQLYKKQHPEKQFSFVIGADLVAELSKWRHPQKLKKEVHFMICNRAGFEIDHAVLPDNYAIVEIPPLEASSTSIMAIAADSTLEAVQKQRQLEKLLSSPVTKLLQSKDLIA